MKTFDASVGNPPYQISTSKTTNKGEKNVQNVFHLYQETSLLYSYKTALIYPADRWIHQTGLGLKEFGKNQLNSRTLTSIHYWRKSKLVFPDVFLNGISIVKHDNTKTNNGTWKLYNIEEKEVSSVALPGERILSLDPLVDSISEKVLLKMRDENISSLKEAVNINQKLFQLGADVVLGNKKSVLVNSDFSNVPSDDEKWVLVSANDKLGKAGKSTLWWFPASEVPRNKHLIDKWKVTVSSANPSGLNRRSPQLDIVPPQAIWGRVRLGIGFFETENEARNFVSFMETDLMRLLQTASGDLLGAYASVVPYMANLYKELPEGDLNKYLLDFFDLSDKEDDLHGWVSDHFHLPQRHKDFGKVALQYSKNHC